MNTISIGAVSLFLAVSLQADEGMWLFNQPPRQYLQEHYQFDPSDAWLRHLQKSSIRFNSGGSGSFISADGLLISNHHVGADALQKLSNEKTNYLKLGFYAKVPSEEVKCLDLELNVLQSIEDVTARVNAALPSGADAAGAFAARRKIIAEIERESDARTGLRSDVVTLWEGGAYHLYRFKRYTDVRLVFAPEQQTAFYGGDPDNFEFPRYDLDICLFRAYENGKPAKIHDYLRVSTIGARDGDLVLVSGNPGSTGRSLTLAEVEDLRDHGIPYALAMLKRVEVLLANWSNRNPENARRARESFFGIQNSRKDYDGIIAGLLDPDLIGAKAKAETEFKTKLAERRSDPVAAAALDAYQSIDHATRVLSAQAVRDRLLEGTGRLGGWGFSCDSFRLARALLRAGDEFPKPNGERLHEFTDSSKVSLELGLFSEKPIYTDLEMLTLADSLTDMTSTLGVGDPLARQILAGKSPRERAAELITGTRVRDVAFRRKLYQGGAAAVRAANDPMIELARLVDPEARALRKVSEEQGEIKHQAHAAIARARNALLGTEGYPDATFTPRLAFGAVKGYEEDGHPVPAMTTMAGLYERAAQHQNQPPFDLTPPWIARKSALDLTTPFNFVSTCDIIGGNSGSPVVNRAGEFVGIIFDGNLESLSWSYAYSDKAGRATSVHSSAIIEALEKVYLAKDLAAELINGHR